MFLKIFKSSLVILSLCFFCSCSESSSPTTNSENNDIANQEPYSKSAIITDQTYTHFTRYIDVNGLRLFARDKVTNDYINKVATIVENIITHNAEIDIIQQKKLIESMTSNRVHQRIGYYKEKSFDEYPGINKDITPEYGNNLTDYIWESTLLSKKENIGEVIEHLLHTITHSAFSIFYPTKWNWQNNESQLYKAMQEAIDKNIYNTSNYNELKEDVEAYNKTLTTEFAYWLILAEWDYFKIAGKKQDSFNGTGNDEFTIGTSSEVKDQLPLAHALYENTIKPLLNKPNTVLVESLF